MNKNNANVIRVLQAMQENTRNLYRKDGAEIEGYDKGWLSGLQTAIWLIQDKNYFHDMADLFDLTD